MSWISVKDRLPAIDQEVLVFSLGSTTSPYMGSEQAWIFIAKYNEQKEFITGLVPFYLECHGCDGGKVEGVAHWMPLPETPKE